MKKRSFVIRLCAAFIPVLILVGVFFLPTLFHDDTEIVTLDFAVIQQEISEEAAILRGSFEGDMSDQRTLWLYAEHAEINLYVDGEWFCYNTREHTPAIFRSPGSGWFRFDIPVRGIEEAVEITIRSYYGEHEKAAADLLSRLYLGEEGDLYRLLLGQLNFFGLILIFSLISGIFYMAEGAVDVASGIPDIGIRIGIFGLYCFSGGLWCVTDILYPYATLLIEPLWVAAFLDMFGLLLFPIALAAMMRYYMRGKHTHRTMSVILYVEIATAIICLILQFTGRADIFQMQIGISIIALLSLLLAVVCIVVEMRHYRDGYLLLLLFTVLPVFVGIIIDGVNVLWPFAPRRVMMGYCFGISILILILQLFCYARVEAKKEEALRQMEKKVTDSRISVLLSQIRPHFLYNSLLSIKQLCDVEPKKASVALEHFSYYLRGNFYSMSVPELIPFEMEIDHVQDYIYLETIRFEERLRVQWELDFVEFMLPSLTLQPIVENAIHHGITKREKGGIIIIRSEKMEQGIRITVTDNGVGFDQKKDSDASRPHIGLNNVKERLETQARASLRIESKSGVGTIVTIMLPREEKIDERTFGG